MKKVIFMLAAGAIALSSCSETEVIEQGVQTNAIGFTNHVSKGSRAITTDNFDHFKVYGSYTLSGSDKPVDIFSGGQDVNKVEGKWTYSPTRNWIKDATYTFAAYAVDKGAALPGRANYGSEIDGNAYYLNLAEVVIDGGNGHQLDIVYAKPDKEYVGKDKGNEIVALEFKHILSRLDFTFKSELPDGFNAEISNVRLVSVRNTGLFDGKDLAWKNVDRTVAVDLVAPIQLGIIGNDGKLEKEKPVTTGYAYVIPFEYTVKNVGIRFNIKITDSRSDDATIIDKDVSAYWAPQWAKNNTYSYTIIINGTAAGLEPIEFTGSVADWETGTPSTPEFNIDPQPLPGTTEP